MIMTSSEFWLGAESLTGDATLTVVAVDDVGLLVRSTISLMSTALCLTGVLRHSSGWVGWDQDDV